MIATAVFDLVVGWVALVGGLTMLAFARPLARWTMERRGELRHPYSTWLMRVCSFSGILHLAAPEEAVGFWRRYSERLPTWRKAMFIPMFMPVDAAASRSVGIGSLIVAAGCVLCIAVFS